MSGVTYLLENRPLKKEVRINWMSSKGIIESSPICDCKILKSMGGSSHLFICDQLFWRKCGICLREKKNV